MTVRLVTGSAEPPAAGGCGGEPGYDADIIILSLNRPHETITAIDSACCQTNVAVHVFVLDQGSDPDTLRRLADALRDRPTVTLLAGDSNLGVAGGRNLLSVLGRGRVIVALDNDAEFATPATVSHLVAALDAEPRLAAIGCRIVRHCDGSDDLSSWGYSPDLLARSEESFETITYVGAGHAIRRAAWEQAGGYDPKLFFCWEEFDFCLRAIALGWRIRYRGDIVVRHKVAPEQRVDWHGGRWFYFVRNRLYIERKLGRSWPVLVPRIGGYLLKGSRNHLLTQTLRAIMAAAAMAPRASCPPLAKASSLYLSSTDRAYRGSPFHRLTHEVLARIDVSKIAASATRR